MIRLGTSLVDCGGADQCAEAPTAPNEMAAIQTDGCFIGILNRSLPLTLRDLGDEIGDVALDLVRWQIVAGL